MESGPLQDVSYLCSEINGEDVTLMVIKPTYGELEQKVRELESEALKRKQAEQALMESEVRYRGIVENTINGIAVYQARDNGDDFIFLDFNSAAEKIENINRTDVIGRSVFEVFPGVKEFGLFDVFRRVWRTGIPEGHPVSIYSDERIVGWRDNFVYKLPSGEIVAVYSDETERKQSEEALRNAHAELREFSRELEKKVQERTAELEEKNKKLIEAEKLTAMGKMANRVAHELRNSLTVIGGFARRMDEKMPEDDSLKRYIAIILAEVTVLEKKVSEIIKIKEQRD